MSESWETYFTLVEDHPAAILCDVGLAENAPDAGKPMLLSVVLYLTAPTEDGFASEEDEEKLTPVEDAFIDAVEATCQAMLVGRITTDGRREFYFYASSGDGFEDTVDEALEQFEDVEYQSDIFEDPEWSEYFNVLYPLPENFQQIYNMKVIEAAITAGDDIEKPRPVDHFLYFESEADQSRFAKAAQKQGFTVADQSKSEDREELQYLVHLQKTEPIDFGTIDETTLELFQLAQQYNGDYDGWGAPVVKG